MQPQDITPAEEWRILPAFGTEPDEDHRTYYEVSSLGRVRSVRTCIRRPYVTDRGYAHVALYRGNRRQSPRISRLVATAFLGPSGDAMEANHLNGNKSDNSASNLGWATSSENKRHAITTGLTRRPA